MSWVRSSTSSQIDPSDALINPVNGKVIKVKNTPISFRAIAEESKLATAILEAPLLKPSHSDVAGGYTERFRKIGLAVTFLGNFGDDSKAKELAKEIITKSPRTPSVEIYSDAAMLARGSDFVLSFTDKEHINQPVNAVTHAAGLRIGRIIMERGKLQFHLGQFAGLWEAPMNNPRKKNEAEKEVIAGSVRKLREVFDSQKG